MFVADDLKNSVLPRALSDVVADLADLLQKEIRLARAEMSAKLSSKLRAGAWISVAAGLGIVAALLIVQALVFGLTAATGLAVYWSCLIVAALLGVAAGVACGQGKADAEEELTPNRTIHQVKEDLAAAKEQFT
jgi:hypothetical protein